MGNFMVIRNQLCYLVDDKELVRFRQKFEPEKQKQSPKYWLSCSAQCSCCRLSSCLEPEEDFIWWNVSRLQLRVEEIFLPFQRAEL